MRKRPMCSRSLQMVLLLLAISITGVVLADPRWRTLDEDNLHDPNSPAIGVLQQPEEALSLLPPDTSGNKVNWVEALEKGVINPRTNIWQETKVRIRNTNVLMRNTGEMPIVFFPHRQHTLWLDCTNCHGNPFNPKVGDGPINMMKILQGESCGRCHGAVAFPLTECNRCHSVPRDMVNKLK